MKKSCNNIVVAYKFPDYVVSCDYFQLYLFFNGLTFETLSGCNSISPYFNATLTAYWKHLPSLFFGLIVAFFFFIQSE